MKTAIVIVNGLNLPYFLIDQAIAWAKREGARLQALFLISGKEVPENYIYPSDIDLAETMTNIGDTQKASETILHDEMKLLNDMAKAEGVACVAELLNDPTLEQVLEKTKQAAMMFVAPGYGDMAQLAITRFGLPELIEKANCPVEVVNDKN